MQKKMERVRKIERKVLSELEKTERWFQRFWFRTFLVVCFAIAMAYLESTVVVYLREMFALHYVTIQEGIELALRLPHFALIKNPLVIVPSLRILVIEIFREAATIMMLFAFAFLVGRKWRERLAVFLLSFALWDIFYYLFLYVMIGWPKSLFTLDVLFLIPLPWLAPVWLPISISCLMIITAVFLFRWQLLINKKQRKR